MAATSLTLADTRKDGLDAVLRRIPSPRCSRPAHSRTDPDLGIEIVSERDLFDVWQTEVWLLGRTTGHFSFSASDRPDLSALIERLMPLADAGGLMVIDRNSAIRIRAHLGAAMRNDAIGSLREACARRDNLARRLTREKSREVEGIVQLESQLIEQARICRELLCELGATFFEREERFVRGLYALACPATGSGDSANVIYPDFRPRPDEAIRTLPLKMLLANEVAGVTAAQRLCRAGMFTLGDLVLPSASQRLLDVGLISIELQALDNVLCRFNLQLTAPRQLALAL